MKRFAPLVVLFGLALTPVFAQETHEAAKEAESGPNMVLLWVNFAMLVGGLAYLAKKFGGPFLAARAVKIDRDMAEAAEQRKSADQRAAEVDRKLASLETELNALRAESKKEIETQRARAAQQAEQEMAKIRGNSEQEVASAGKAVRAELRRFSAELAIGLAEQKIKSRMTPEAENELLRGFVKDLAHTDSKVRSN